MFPEAHTFAFDVLSCAIVSSFISRTVVPDRNGQGTRIERARTQASARSSESRPVCCRLLEPASACGVVGDIVEEEEPPPHATRRMETIVRRLNRKELITCLPLPTG